MVSRSLVAGYHGCDIRVARKVISLKDSLHPSQNRWDWLGHGLYFWEDSLTRARRWAEAESKQRDSKIKHPAVLGSVIDLGNCLNLADAEALKQVGAAHDAYLQICAETGDAHSNERRSECR